MATVTGYTAEKMDEISNNTVVDGNIVGNDLILVTRGGAQINAGNVRGPQGIQGPTGEVSSTQLNSAIASAVATVQAANAVTNAMLALNAVTTEKIANLSVTTDKIAEGAVTASKIATNTITGPKLAPGSVTNSRLEEHAVSANKIMPGNVGTGQLADLSVTRAKLAANAVDYWKQGFIFVQPNEPPGVDGGIWVIP